MTKKMMRMLSIGMSGLILLVSGCAHPLQVRNLSSYRSVSINPLDKRITVGIVPSTDEIHSRRLIKGIGEALGRHNANVILPYPEGSTKKVDAVATISVQPEYKGSGWNFLVNFPGFLVWAPAWNGYVYRVNYNVDVLLTKAADGSKIDSWSIPVNLDVRHAGMNRTWTEISWLEVGAIAFIGGLVFTQYDNGVTPLVMDKIELSIGDYIAQEIVNRLNGSGSFSHIWEHVPSQRLALLPGSVSR